VRPTTCVEFAKCHRRVVRIQTIDDERPPVERERFRFQPVLLDDQTVRDGFDLDVPVRPRVDPGVRREVDRGTECRLARPTEARF
jgi:hypothetical protein